MKHLSKYSFILFILFSFSTFTLPTNAQIKIIGRLIKKGLEKSEAARGGVIFGRWIIDQNKEDKELEKRKREQDILLKDKELKKILEDRRRLERLLESEVSNRELPIDIEWKEIPEDRRRLERLLESEVSHRAFQIVPKDSALNYWDKFFHGHYQQREYHSIESFNRVYSTEFHRIDWGRHF